MANWNSPLLLTAIVAACVAAARADDKPAGPLSFTMKSITGQDVNLADYKGKIVLMVNVASDCGLTPQYQGLQAIYEKYKDRGLVVLGFPCNQFGGQEPGTEGEIKAFCETRYGVTFPMFAKVDVNGAKRHPLYEFLTSAQSSPDGAGDIQWNFAKFLVDRSGNVVARFGPATAPVSGDVVGALEKQLG